MMSDRKDIPIFGGEVAGVNSPRVPEIVFDIKEHESRVVQCHTGVLVGPDFSCDGRSFIGDVLQRIVEVEELGGGGDCWPCYNWRASDYFCHNRSFRISVLYPNYTVDQDVCQGVAV